MRIIKLLSFALILFITSCKKTSAPVENFYVAFKATLSGTKETPANSSAASGTVEATYNKNTKILALYITYSGLTATQGHVHKGAAGVAGPTVFAFPNLVSPINYTSIALDATQEADLLANFYYVNLHSAAYTNGEIRGQLIKQ